jgi:uncharacterized protein
MTAGRRIRAVDDAGPPGYACRPTEHKGVGVFATRGFEVGETVMVGAAVRRASGNDAHAVQTGPNEFGHEEGLGSFVNHSCGPNCGIRLTDRGMFDLVARRTIGRDEEITIDYAMRNYVIEYFPESCRCGSPLCRDLVTGWKNLPVDRRIAYEGSVAPFLFEIVRLKNGSDVLMSNRQAA